MSRSTPYTSLGGASAVLIAGMLLVWWQISEPILAAASDADQHRTAAGRIGYARTVAVYSPPKVDLVAADGAETPLAEALDYDGLVLLQFVFTSCPGVCPVLSASFSGVQRRLGDQRDRVRMISISIDPEFDTPQRLRRYARQFGAGPQWSFFTGSRNDVIAVQKAFDAYRGNKMRHEPVTFLKANRGDRWLRLDGFPTAAQLLEEVRISLGG